MGSLQLSDSDFVQFKSSLDAEMKRLQRQGIGSKRRQAEALNEEEEEILWEKELLGDKSPQTLLDTIVFCNGLYFALRSGKEHRQLRMKSSQIELVEKTGERGYLKYTEDTSKTRQGGLKERNIKPKVVYHHENVANPDRCFVRLYKKYVKLCPRNLETDAFYLHPASKPTPECWFSNRPIGHSTLSKTVSRLCQAAGISGFKTNHF